MVNTAGVASGDLFFMCWYIILTKVCFSFLWDPNLPDLKNIHDIPFLSAHLRDSHSVWMLADAVVSELEL